MTTAEISVQELKKLMDEAADFIILDVREPAEYAICNLRGLLIPFKELPDRLHELNKDQKIIIHCHGGGRSKRATDFLMTQGFNKVFNLRGGITAWANEIEPSMQKY